MIPTHCLYSLLKINKTHQQRKAIFFLLLLVVSVFQPPKTTADVLSTSYQPSYLRAVVEECTAALPNT